MELLTNELLGTSWLSLRDVFRLLLLSGLFTVATLLAFPRNAPTRRALLLAAVTALTVIPVVLAVWPTLWTIPLEEVPMITLNAAIPMGVVIVWLGVAGLLAGTHLVRARDELSLLHALPGVTGNGEKVAALLNTVEEMSASVVVAAPKVKEGDLACASSIKEPTIVLPFEWREWDETTLRGVIAHELIHIQRRDDVWLMVIRLLRITYWWMPWLLKLESTYVRVMEESCDDAASELVGHEVHYVDALVKAAGVSGANTTFSTAMHAHHLVGRVGRFTHHRMVELDTGGVYWCVTAIVVVVALLTSVEPVLKTSQGLPGVTWISAKETHTTARQRTQPSYIPKVFEHAELPVNVAKVDRERLMNPEYAPPVIYPGAAIRRQEEGEAVVLYEVGRDGGVSKARLASASSELFGRAALRTVNQTRYTSGYTTGRLIRKNQEPQIEVRRIFRFRMASD
ncbi:MAG: TonB family protein [Pseudomonadales bacterium]|nr:TonB family protein [Pseudomonadales bacterium]